MKSLKHNLEKMIREAVKTTLSEGYYDSDSDPNLTDAADDLVSMAKSLAHQLEHKSTFGHPDPEIELKKAALEIINKAERQLSEEIEDMERSW